MARIEPIPREQLPEFEPLFELVGRGMGFVPNSLLVMARRPELLRAFAALAGVVNGPGKLPAATRQLVAFVASHAAGCRYCQAHTSAQAARLGTPVEKVAAAFEFETSPLFDEAERAALRLARDAALSAPAVTDEHFAQLCRHYDEAEILEIVSVIALFGFLNRWNDTLATPLEAEPLRFAEEHLGGAGWGPGPHASRPGRR